jgi:molybdenum cofactor biosynthesis enzyme MoaA
VTQCNLNCIHCISREFRATKSILSPHIKDKIKHRCDAGSVGKIATDYSGDILWADKKFGGELDLLKSLNVPVHIDTNGIYLDQEAAEALVESRLESINISLDAATSKTFQRVRKGAPRLDNVLTNIANFMAIREKSGADHIDVT